VKQIHIGGETNPYFTTEDRNKYNFAEMLRPLADNNVVAQFLLASIYAYPLNGEKQNYEKAFDLYLRAAEQGYGPAQNIIGIMYATGMGVKENPKEALRWYEAADAQEAIFSLRGLYSDLQNREWDRQREEQLRQQEQKRLERERSTLESQRQREEQLRQRQSLESYYLHRGIIFLLILAVPICGLAFYLIRHFARAKCPKCGKRKTLKLDEEEMDRWRGSKQVTDKNKDGKIIRTRTIAVDYAKMRLNWKCKECGNNFHTFKTREL
jgi:ribosomal protein S27AE